MLVMSTQLDEFYFRDMVLKVMGLLKFQWGFTKKKFLSTFSVILWQEPDTLFSMSLPSIKTFEKEISRWLNGIFKKLFDPSKMYTA